MVGRTKEGKKQKDRGREEDIEESSKKASKSALVGGGEHALPKGSDICIY